MDKIFWAHLIVLLPRAAICLYLGPVLVRVHLHTAVVLAAGNHVYSALPLWRWIVSLKWQLEWIRRQLLEMHVGWLSGPVCQFSVELPPCHSCWIRFVAVAVQCHCCCRYFWYFFFYAGSWWTRTPLFQTVYQCRIKSKSLIQGAHSFRRWFCITAKPYEVERRGLAPVLPFLL